MSKYATDNAISFEPLPNCIKITDAEYDFAFNQMLGGKRLTIQDNKMVFIDPSIDRNEHLDTDVETMKADDNEES